MLDIPQSTVSGVIGKWNHLGTEASHKVEDYIMLQSGVTVC